MKTEHLVAVENSRKRPQRCYPQMPIQNDLMPAFREVHEHRVLPEDGKPQVAWHFSFFTDGACAQSRDRHIRRASWSVIHCSHPEGQWGQVFPKFQCLATTMAQGKQTPAYYAVKFAAEVQDQRNVHVIADSQYMVYTVKAT